MYKSGKENHVANALSQQPDELMAKFLALSQVCFTLLDSLHHENTTSAFFLARYMDLEEGVLDGDEYEVRDGLQLHKGRLLLDPISQLVHLVIQECHSKLSGGHGGMQKTMAKVSAAFTSLGMK